MTPSRLRAALASLPIAMGCGGPASAGAPVEGVIVIRGAELSQQSEGVVVMRPAQGSFLRETTRLAGEADAREERAAAKRARYADQRVAQALATLARAASASQSRYDDDLDHHHVWVMQPRPIPGIRDKVSPPVAPFRMPTFPP